MIICMFICLFVCSLVYASLVPSKEAGQEVSAVQVKYMLMFREQNSGQNHKIEIGNKSFEKLAKFKYFGTTITNRNCRHGEHIKLWECLLPFSPESFIFQFGIKSVEIKTYKTIIFPIVVYGCETWSL